MSGQPSDADLRVVRSRVVIVGAGPAGLTAAADLAPQVDGEVLILDRESEPGGIPRHSDHVGYGIRDLRRFTSGPRYARYLARRARAAGAVIMTHAMVTDWAGERALHVTTPEGRIRVEADCVVLATGARERPRSARLLAGDRVDGVYTTGHLQNLVHAKGERVGRRAVVVGAELVSWSAVMTLRHAGCRTAELVTRHERPDSYGLFNRLGPLLFRTRVTTHARVTRILGRAAVEGVEVEDLRTGNRRIVECDTVVLTGDWIPDNELARAGGVRLDVYTKGPRVDNSLRTDKPGVFAIGNCLHPVDTADVAALDGAAVTPHILRYLHAGDADVPTVALAPEGPIRWLAPQLLRGDLSGVPRGRLVGWVDRYIAFPRVTVAQGGRIVTRRRLWWPAAPGRAFRIPERVLRGVDPQSGGVTVGIEER